MANADKHIINEYVEEGKYFHTEKFTGSLNDAVEDVLLRLVEQWNKEKVLLKHKNPITKNALNQLERVYASYSNPFPYHVEIGLVNRFLDVITTHYTFWGKHREVIHTLTIEPSQDLLDKEAETALSPNPIHTYVSFYSPIMLACKLSIRAMIDQLRYPPIMRSDATVNVIMETDDDEESVATTIGVCSVISDDDEYKNDDEKTDVVQGILDEVEWMSKARKFGYF